jgi:hypothetical protein
VSFVFVLLGYLLNPTCRSHDQVATFSDKTFLFRDVAQVFIFSFAVYLIVYYSLEIYFKDSRSLLVVFLDKQRRRDIDQRLLAIVSRYTPSDAALSATPGRMRTPRFGKVFQRSDELSIAQGRWQAREISNVSFVCTGLS